MKLASLLLLILAFCTTHAQEKKDDYTAFMKNGIEYKTNGKDTIVIVDPMPEFKGGKSRLIEYLSNNINYPEKARRNEIEGKVFVNFIVAEDGKIIDCKVVKGVSPELDKEALRVAKKMPKWKPGEQHGKPIRVTYTLPINFKL
ncbi:energy transducer TonB [Maribellus sp. CM-23]|uniref:energy transducer TonB n=1 Tax=Maribellus sp. CM-23 TaxID=2781026 RepID=UPI001F4015DD|nr:energy transducer TonB [Maribellus sp. CM-23]MCE4562763.1 energy transducer TonB [Maribellus sp. CM-23]